MTSNIPEIRKIKLEELPIVRDFPPVEWNLNLEDVYKQHFNQPYFYAAIAILEDEVIGTGMSITNKNVSWLGTIIVKDNHRKKGIGNLITKHLIDHAKKQDVNSILLTASELGLSIYEKLGFIADNSYLFFKTTNPKPFVINNTCIKKISEPDYSGIYNLDYEVTGEERTGLLKKFIITGFKYEDNEIKGFYLPEFGKGLIIAKDETAGIELLKFKITNEKSPVCVPESNKKAIDFLLSIGYLQYSKIPRMFLQKNVEWKPENIYSRGSGYMG